MFAGNLTENTETNSFTGTLRSRNFDIAIQLVDAKNTKTNAPDFDIVAKNTSGRMIRIGSAWDQESKSGNRYLSMKVDVGEGPFRINAVQSEDARGSDDFEIIPFVANGMMKSGSISGELTAMDADNAFAGYIANMMIDLNFTLVENDYKTEETHPDYRIQISSPKNNAIRIGSAWLAKSKDSGNDYISLLINTPDGDLRVNAVQNEEQRGGDTFSIIPFVDADNQIGNEGQGGLALVG